MNSRYTTLDEIIERVQRDFGFDVNDSEAAEWVWDVVTQIGVLAPFEEKIKEITIEDYKGVLPIDLYGTPKHLRDSETFVELRRTLDGYFFSDNKWEAQDNEIIQTQDVDPLTDEPFYTTVPPATYPEYYTYKLQGNYIFIGYSTAILEMVYDAFPVNESDGTPLITDDTKYIKAIVEFIAEKEAFRLFLKDELSERKYDKIAQKASFSLGAARSKGLIPDRSEMETIRNRWMSPHPYYEHFETGNVDMGSRNRYNNQRRWR